MVSKLIILGQGDICRLRLGFKSLVKFMSLVGFCAGIGGIPIYFVLVLVVPRLFENAESITAHDLPFLILFILVGVPVIALLDAAFFAILAFPLYRLLSNRIYTGEFELLKKDDA
jgi:hypothetical protein